MKHLKKFLPALTLIVAAVMAFSFTSSNMKDDYLICEPEYVFTYNGTGSKFDPDNYTFQGTLEGHDELDPAPNCPGAEVVCAIIVCEDYVDNIGFAERLKDAFLASTGVIGLGIVDAESLQDDEYYDPNHSPAEWVIFLRTEIIEG